MVKITTIIYKPYTELIVDNQIGLLQLRTTPVNLSSASAKCRRQLWHIFFIFVVLR